MQVASITAIVQPCLQTDLLVLAKAAVHHMKNRSAHLTVAHLPTCACLSKKYVELVGITPSIILEAVKVHFR